MGNLKNTIKHGQRLRVFHQDVTAGGVTVQIQKKIHIQEGTYILRNNCFFLHDAAKIKLAITSLHCDALLGHNCCDKLGGCNIKTGVIDPVQPFRGDHDGGLSLVALLIKGRRIQCAAHDACF